MDPELAVNRAIALYRSRGYDDAWIKERLEQIQERKALTDEWRRVGVKELQFAVLTNDIYKAIADMSTKEYKEFKGLKGKANLRDNMTATENALTRIGEIATREISQNENPTTFEQSRSVARRGGGVARAGETSWRGSWVAVSFRLKTRSPYERPRLNRKKLTRRKIEDARAKKAPRKEARTELSFHDNVGCASEKQVNLFFARLARHFSYGVSALSGAKGPSVRRH